MFLVQKIKFKLKTFFRKQLLSEIVELNNVTNRFVENNLLINHYYNYIYCPIPKVACSSFKKLTVLLSDIDNKQEILDKLHSRDFHTYIHNQFSLSNYDKQAREQLLSNSKYFKFVIVRNPWIRLYSAYIDKFVRAKNLEDFTLNIIVAIYKKKKEQPDFIKSINFQEFVEYICQIKDDSILNSHWRPQYTFLGNIKFDFIGKFETLDQDFLYLKNKLGINISLPKINQIEREIQKTNQDLRGFENCFQIYPSELKKIIPYPSYIFFYHPELIEMVRAKYIKDIKKFQYDYI